MVLDYHQLSFRYATVLRQLDVGVGGAQFRNLVNLSSRRIDATVHEGAIVDLRFWLSQSIPPIVFVATKELPYWTIETFHAVVIIGMDDENVYLADPAFNTSPQIAPIGDFDLAWFEMGESYGLIRPK